MARLEGEEMWVNEMGGACGAVVGMWGHGLGEEQGVHGISSKHLWLLVCMVYVSTVLGGIGSQMMDSVARTLPCFNATDEIGRLEPESRSGSLKFFWHTNVVQKHVLKCSSEENVQKSKVATLSRLAAFLYIFTTYTPHKNETSELRMDGGHPQCVRSTFLPLQTPPTKLLALCLVCPSPAQS